MHLRLLASLSVIASLALALPALAAPAPGDLVRTTSNPSVYYYGVDGKRYVFPNERTYFTWYANYDGVKTVTDAELAAMPIGGAVTYRPGIRLVKITTDPKVYSVTRGGVLRWITTESLAQSILGKDWSKNVDDVPDEYFATYRLGLPASVPADYNPIDQQNSSPTIEFDKGLKAPSPITPAAPKPMPVTPAPQPTSAVTLSASATSVRYGQEVTLTATASSPNGLQRVDIFFDGDLVNHCSYSPCSTTVKIPLGGSRTEFTAGATAISLDTTQANASIRLPLATGPSPLIKLSLGRDMVRAGQLAEAVVDVGGSINILRTDIAVGGQTLKTCGQAIQRCAWTDYLTGSVGTAYDVVAKVTDTYGNVYESVHKTVTLGANDSPAVSILVGQSSIASGGSVDVHVLASDDDGIDHIDILQGDIVVGSCKASTTCAIVTGPWKTPGTLTFRGRAVDSKGADSTTDSVTTVVQ